MFVQVMVKQEDAKPAKAQPSFSLSSMCAAQLLLEFVSDGHQRLLGCWSAHALELDKLAALALAATGKRGDLTGPDRCHCERSFWLLSLCLRRLVSICMSVLVFA